MLLVLVVAACVWAILLLAVCAVCAVGGAADEQSEKWYRESRSAAEDVDQQKRGAAWEPSAENWESSGGSPWSPPIAVPFAHLVGVAARISACLPRPWWSCPRAPRWHPGGEVLNAQGVTTDALGSNGSSAVSESSHP